MKFLEIKKHLWQIKQEAEVMGEAGKSIAIEVNHILEDLEKEESAEEMIIGMMAFLAKKRMDHYVDSRIEQIKKEYEPDSVDDRKTLIDRYSEMNETAQRQYRERLEDEY